MHRVIWRLAIASTTDDGSKIGIPTKNVEFLPAAHTSLLCYFQNPPALMCKNTDLILMMAHIHRTTTSNKNVPFPSLSCIFDKSYIALLPDNQTTLLGYNYYNLSSRRSITKTFETILGHM